MIDGSRAGSNSSCTAFAGLLQQCQRVELECVEGLRVVVLELEKGAVRNGLSSACCAVLCCGFYYHRMSYRAPSTRPITTAGADMRVKILSWDEAKAIIMRGNASKKELRAGGVALAEPGW
jgi:hypothetical protein